MNWRCDAMAKNTSNAKAGDTPAPYCKLSRDEALLVNDLRLSGMEASLYLLYASQRRPVDGRPGIYSTSCSDARAADLLGVDRCRITRMRAALVDKGAIACVNKMNGRTPTCVLFPPQNNAIADYLESLEDPDSFEEDEDNERSSPASLLSDYLEEREGNGLTVRAHYWEQGYGRVDFDTSDVQKDKRADFDTSGVQKDKRQTCNHSHARCALNQHVRGAENNTSGDQSHSESCTGIQSDAQVGSTTDDLCNHELGGETRAAAGGSAAAAPLPLDTKPEPDREEDPNASILGELTEAQRMLIAKDGHVYFLCPECGHPVIRRLGANILLYDCIRCGETIVIKRGTAGEKPDFANRSDPRLVQSTNIPRTIAELEARGARAR